MQFTIVTILAAATAVMAIPQYGAPAPSQGATQGSPQQGAQDPSDPSSNSTGMDMGSLTCAKGSQVSCCVSNNGNSGLLGNVLGGSCLLDQVSLASLLDNICPAGNTFCCPSNQDGTLNINAECLPINA